MSSFFLGFGIAAALAVVAVGLSWQKWGVVREVEVYRPDPNMVEMQIAYGNAKSKIAELEAQISVKDDELKAAYDRLDVIKGEVRAKQESIVRSLEGRAEYLYRQVEELGLDLADEKERNRSLTMQIDTMRKFIEHQLGVPGYAVAVSQADRDEAARRLFVERGWSRRKIQMHFYGYTGGQAARRVSRALADPQITGQGTAIVPYKERFQGLEWVLPGALLGL